MITKKIGDELFAWNPDAFSGKGYWFVLGKKGGYGRAASKKEMTSLGKPEIEKSEKKEQKQIESKVEANKNEKEVVDKPIKQIKSQESIIPQKKTQDSGKKPDIPKKKRKTPLSDFVETQKKTRSSDKKTNVDSLRLKFTGDTVESIKKGDSIADSLGKIFTLIKTKNQYEKDFKGSRQDRIEEDEIDNQIRHGEIISAITGGKAEKPKLPIKLKKLKPKPKTKEKKEKDSTFKKILKKATKPAIMIGGGLLFKSPQPKQTATKSAEPGATGTNLPAPPPPKQTATKSAEPGVTNAKPSSEPTANKVKAPPTSDDTKKMIMRHEGAVPYPYKDSKGLWTIGVGHLIGDGKTLPPEYDAWKNNGAANAKGNNTKPALTQEQMNKLFEEDYQKHEKIAEKGPGFDKANEPAQGAFVDMAFNMGAWWVKFKNAAKAANSGDWSTTADELSNSAWHKQVGSRADEVIGLVKHAGDGEPTGKDSNSSSPNNATPLPPAPPLNLTGSGVSEGQNPQISDPTRAAALDSVTKKQSNVDTSKLNGSLAKRVSAMAAAFKEKTGKMLLITSAFRSNEKQKELWDAELARNHGDVAATKKKVAEPSAPLGNGKGSLHAMGLAIDINSKGSDGLNVLAGTRENSTGWLESFGLTRPVKGEDWHVQVAGTPPAPDNPVKPGAPVLVAGKGDTATNVSTGQAKPIPSETATSVDFKPKSSNLAAVSTQNKDLKDDQKQKSTSAPIIVNNNNTVTHGPSTTTVTQSNPQDNTPPGFSG